MSVKLTKDDCVFLLLKKYETLKKLPKKSDFSDDEVAYIKSYFGPWPRALEAVGIKEPNPLREQKKIGQTRKAKSQPNPIQKRTSKGE